MGLRVSAMVPVIKDGDFVLWESNAICRYLASKHGREDLLPADPMQRARVEQWMDWQAGELNNAWRYAFMALVRHSPLHTDRAAIEGSIANWNRHMEMLDSQLSKTRAYAAGPDFTLADIVLGLSANRWLRTPMVRPDCPAISDYFERLGQRAGFRSHGANGLA
jgi:glutathione S-transferase